MGAVKEVGTVQLPKEYILKLKALAKSQKRSMTAQIQYMIDKELL